MRPGTPLGKIARRLDVAPTLKTAKVVTRRPYPPGESGTRRQGTPSVYKQQLLEKQKLRFQFMISEKVLQRAFSRAKKFPGETGGNLVKLLDRRLDATIFRAGVVRSVPAARQLVTHRHVLVNDKRVYSPSYLLKPKDVVSFSPRAKKFGFLQEGFEQAQPIEYVNLDKEAFTIIRSEEPERSAVPVMCNEQLVVEWYSR